MGYKVRYPIEKMVFGVSSSYGLPVVEDDDIYTTSNMGRFYCDEQIRRPMSSHYRRKLEKSINQYDVTVDDIDYVVARSMPRVFTADMDKMRFKSEFKRMNDVELHFHEEPMHEPFYKYGTSLWFEKMNSKLHDISQEAFTFMRSGLTIVSDFEWLRIPIDIKHENLSKLFWKFREESKIFMNRYAFGIRDEVRQLLEEEYITQADLSMVPSPIMLEEQSHMRYYRSVFFNTSSIKSESTGKVVLPRTKPYSTWVTSGFALNQKSGLSIAQPIRLPTNQGLYLLANFPKHVQTVEHVLLTYGINNYLGKDLTNVILRIRASPDFELFEESKAERLVSSIDKDYALTIPSLKSGDVTRHSSLYLTSLAFGAMISPMMSFRDKVTLNRTLNWILSQQQEDGSFDDNGPCFHYRFCSGEFRRQSLTAIVLYSLIRDNSSDYMPESIHHRLYDGKNNPIIRAQNYLESRLQHVKRNLLTRTLSEMACIQNKSITSELEKKIRQALLNRKLTVVPEDDSKYIEKIDENMSFDDQLLLNAMTISLYANFVDSRTASDIARWVVSQFQLHPHYTEKNFRGIINPEKGFMTSKSVYQRALPFDKPFFLKKVGKGLSPVAN